MVNKRDFRIENDAIYGMMVVDDPGDSEDMKAGQLISPRKLRDENTTLQRKDMKVGGCT